MNSNKSTSFHNISADYDLTFTKRIKWLFVNLINNFFSSLFVDKELQIYNYDFNKHINLFKQINLKSSPARILCDVFWQSFPWSKIINFKKKKINFLEVGCGKGVYPLFLSKILLDNFNSYTGIDKYSFDEWSKFNPDIFKFRKDIYDNVNLYLDDIDVLFTQSAIEHFENDLFFFKNILKYIENTKKPIVQIHLFPSKECLSTFLWHGYRQYSPRTISNITKLFDKKYQKILFKLGTTKSNTIHKKYITIPKLFRSSTDLRYSKNEEYVSQLLKSIKPTNKSNQVSFYALVISSTKDYNLNLLDF